MIVVGRSNGGRRKKLKLAITAMTSCRRKSSRYASVIAMNETNVLSDHEFNSSMACKALKKKKRNGEDLDEEVTSIPTLTATAAVNVTEP